MNTTICYRAPQGEGYIALGVNMKSLAIAVSVVLSAIPASADEVCNAAIAHIGSGAIGGIYFATDAGLTGWHALGATDVLGPRVPLVYIRKGTHPGAIAVKITRLNAGSESPTSDVRLRRDDIAQCDIGYATQFVWWLFPRSYKDGVSVTADAYTRYHRDQTQNADIEGFHINYHGRNNACVASNDAANGNRAQFLFDKQRTLSNPYAATAANIGVVGTASAYGATQLKGATFAETIIAVYSASQACASFEFRSAGPGSYVLRLNDLEKRERGNSKEHPKKEMKRRFTASS